MITGDFVNGIHLMVGLSTDSKPTTTSENTFFLEENTGDVYYFSAGEWNEAGPNAAQFVAALLGINTTAEKSGILWSVTDVYLLRQVLENIRYDSDDAEAKVEALLDSLEANPEDQAWTRQQIDLLDDILDYVDFTDPDASGYADELIASLKGMLIEPSGSITLTSNGTYPVSNYADAIVETPTYTDGDEEAY